MSSPHTRSLPLHSVLDLVVVHLLGPWWMAVCLGLHPTAGSAVRWAFYDELEAGPPAQRWRRALPFYLHLWSFASAQQAAETDPVTATEGDPPDPPPTSASTRGRPRFAPRLFHVQ